MGIFNIVFSFSSAAGGERIVDVGFFSVIFLIRVGGRVVRRDGRWTNCRQCRCPAGFGTSG